MTKRFLLSIILVLIITNIVTLLFWNQNNDEANIDVINNNQSGKKITTNDPVAKIGDEEISYEVWLESLQADYGEMHLKKLIDRSVVKQLAEQQQIYINEKLIERGISLLSAMQGVMTEDEFIAIEKKWREDVLHRYQLEALLAEDISVPESDIQSHYDMYHNQYSFTESLQLSHIVVEDNETAEKVLKELDEGASFNLLAMEYSIDEDTKEVGGYLGHFTSTSQFIPSGYYERAINMEEYSYSEPFNSGNGIAIIYLHRHMPEINFAYDEIKDQIKNELALKDQEQVLTADPLWEELNIEWIFE